MLLVIIIERELRTDYYESIMNYYLLPRWPKKGQTRTRCALAKSIVACPTAIAVVDAGAWLVGLHF